MPDVEYLVDEGLLQVAAPDEYGLQRVEAGQQRYLELCQARPTPLRVPRPSTPPPSAVSRSAGGGVSWDAGAWWMSRLLAGCMWIARASLLFELYERPERER